jgi:acetyl esterase
MSEETLDPEIRTLLDDARKYSLPASAVSLSTGRQNTRDLFIADSDSPAVGDVVEVSIPGPGGPLDLRVYVPEKEGPHPIVLHFHGGGWVKGDLDTHDEFCRFLTSEVGCLTVAVDYRRAPEHPFPVPLRDAYRATEWAADYAEAYGGDTDRIAVCGESAGGNLAAAVSLAARDFGGPPLAHQALIYPVLNDDFETDSYLAHADDGLLSRENMMWYWEQYLDDEFDRQHPYAAPLKARDLADLPPATVISAGFDPLRDENLAYVERLRAADVPVRHEDFPRAVHAFHMFPDLGVTSRARAVLVEEMCSAFGES